MRGIEPDIHLFLCASSLIAVFSVSLVKSEWRREKSGSPSSSAGGSGGSGGGSPKNVNLVSAVQDMMMPQIMEVCVRTCHF